jgi:dTDP-4-dehydrorhamnose 3,5-epimerase-like enzyme
MWNDSEFLIDWAIKDPILSEKDKNHQPFSLFISPF